MNTYLVYGENLHKQDILLGTIDLESKKEVICINASNTGYFKYRDVLFRSMKYVKCNPFKATELTHFEE